MSAAVLVVDDEPMIRMFTIDALESFIEEGKLFAGRGKVDILEAGNYQEAKSILADRRAKQAPVDLVLTDGQFPGGSGPQLVKEEVGATPWVGMTGNMSKWDDDARTNKLDVPQPKERVLSKPFALTGLLSAILNAMPAGTA